jgi:hypothetical protein
MNHPRRLAPLLAVVLLVGACNVDANSPSAAGPSASPVVASAIAARALPGGAVAPVDAATWALADRLAAPAYTADTTSAFKEALARAGIAVVADTSTDPATALPEVPLTRAASPFELLDFQAHALAVGAWAGASWTGAALDTVVALPAGTDSPSLAELMAAYAATADTPGGALARALLAGEDLTHPADVRFPAAVLVLFVSDVATDGGRLPAPSPAVRPAPSSGADVNLLPLAAAGPVVGRPVVDIGLICGGPSAWIDAIVGRLEQAIDNAIPQGLVGGLIVGALGWLIHIGVSVIKSMVDALLAPVLSVIRGIAAIASGIAEQIASLLPYSVYVTVAGTTAPNFFLGADPQTGSFDVHVTGGDLPAWPDVLATCARAAGIALPDFQSKEVPLTFGPLQASTGAPLMGPADAAVATTTTDATGQAHWPFVVSRDPGEGHGHYTEQTDKMPVAVHRKELDDLRARLTTALLGQIPGLLRPFVGAILSPILDGIQSRLNTVLDARGQRSAFLWYYQPVPPSPAPPATPAASSACTTTLPAGTYQGTIETKSTTIVPPGQIDLGEAGGDNDHGTGPLTVSVAPDGSLSGSFSVHVLEHMVYTGLAEGTEDTTLDELGAGVSGTLCNPILTFASEVETACTATGHGTCGPTGQTISLAGLVPPWPLGKPTTTPGGVLTWSISGVSHSEAGFGGLSADVQSTETIILNGH